MTTRPVAFVLGASLPHWGKRRCGAGSRAWSRRPARTADAAALRSRSRSAAPRTPARAGRATPSRTHTSPTPQPGHLVGVSRHAHAADNTIGRVSAPGIFRPPAAVNEPIRSYAPGSPERAELQARLARDVRRARPHPDGDRRRARRDGNDVRGRDAASPRRTCSRTSRRAAPPRSSARSRPRAPRTPSGRGRRGTSGSRSSSAPPS